ncbi:hypothetical protein FCOIX_9311 [Fusarium coicis]|nr:hypothetical protein FCOIX_9311 [Fusarium coicis]
MANYGSTSKVDNGYDSAGHSPALSRSIGFRPGLSNEPQKTRENDLCREIERLKREIETQKDTVRRAQEASQAMMEQSKSFASGDNEVEIWFRRRSDDWYEWARYFAHQDPSRLASVPCQAWNGLGEFVALQDGRLPGGLADDPKTPYLLLQGMLANFVCTHAFSTPWWIFDALSHLGVSPEERDRLIHNCVCDEEKTEQILCLDGSKLPTSRSMDTLFDILQHLQEDSSHKLRVSLVRLFSANGMGAGADGSVRGKNEALIHRRIGHAKYLTNMFLQSPACSLLKDLSSEELQGCSDGLEEQIDQALQKSLELWAHRSQMRCIALPQLRDGGRLDFDLGSGLMQLHRAYQVDDWRKYEGSHIVVVVQPAIVVYGTERGDNYSCMRRVWAPAKVLIDEDTMLVKGQPTMLIGVMGVTGSGKSTFVRTASGNDQVTVGHSLEACTQEINAYEFNTRGHNVILVDTPGFNDTYKSDADILLDLAKWLEVMYRQNAKLTGILCLHRITDVQRFDGTQECALDVLMSFATKATMTLDIQRELVDEEKLLAETAAGNAVNEELHRLETKYRDELDRIQKETTEALAERDLQYEKILNLERERMEQKLDRIHSDQEVLRQERREEIRRIENDNKLLQNKYDAKLKEQQLEAERIREQDRAEMREQMQNSEALIEALKTQKSNDELLKIGGRVTQVVALGAMAAFDPNTIPVKFLRLRYMQIHNTTRTYWLDVSIFSGEGKALGKITAQGHDNSNDKTVKFHPDNDLAVLPLLQKGPRLQISNRMFVAMHAVHRYSIPKHSGFYGYDYLRDSEGTAIYPQRPVLLAEQIARSASGGATSSGKFNGKMIVMVKKVYADVIDDKFRLHYTENADHQMGPVLGSKSSRVVEFTGLYTQHLRDLSNWGETGIYPSTPTNYTIHNAQVQLPATASARRGIQPTVDRSVNGGKEVEVKTSTTVTFTVHVEVPSGPGKIISMEWDLERSGNFVKKSFGDVA